MIDTMTARCPGPKMLKMCAVSCFVTINQLCFWLANIKQKRFFKDVNCTDSLKSVKCVRLW